MDLTFDRPHLWEEAKFVRFHFEAIGSLVSDLRWQVQTWRKKRRVDSVKKVES